MKKRSQKRLVIVGGGFSAAIASLFIKEKTKIITFKNNDLLNSNEFTRRKEIECNKLFAKKSLSVGTLNFNLKKIILHDRMVFSGNSSVWGGKINLSNINKKDIGYLQNKKIYFKKLSFKETGTISNINNIYQIQNLNKKILSISDIPIKFENGLLLNFLNKKKKILLRVKSGANKKTKIFEIDKLILCVGSIQLLDLLFRSNFIKDGDKIEFTEFQHKFKLTSVFSKFEKRAVIVRYHISRAIGHYFGIQFYSLVLRLLKFIPLCIDQIFYFKKMKLKFILNKNTITEIRSSNYQSYKPGESIHYCNLKINNVNINKFLKKINPKIIGLGMPFINQKKPGPISNEIILDAKSKFNKIII